METNEDLRRQMISTASAFRFDQSRLDAATIVRAGQQRRRRRRFLGGAVVAAALAATATVTVTHGGESPKSVTAVAAGDVYLVPAGTPQGLVLRRSSAFPPTPPSSYFTAFYSDGGTKRIAVITALRGGVDASTAKPRAVVTASGFWMPWEPSAGVEVIIATVGLSQAETEALFDRVGADAARGATAYGLVTLPAGFRVIGDERDTNFRDGTLNVYSTADANLTNPLSSAPRVDVTVGRASDVYREMDRIIFDQRTTVSIRGHDADVVTHRYTDHGELVTVSWFEQPGVLVDITAYNMATDDAVTFDRSPDQVTLDAGHAHSA